MNFKVECKTCQSRLAIPEELWHKRFAGRLQGLKCKKCGDVITVDDRPKESSAGPTEASSETPVEPAREAESVTGAAPAPVTAEPVVQAETVATEPTGTVPAPPAPTVEAAPTEPVRAEAPSAQARVDAESVKAEPVLPAKAEPVKAEPIKHEVPKTQANAEGDPRRAAEPKKSVKLAPALTRTTQGLGAKRAPSFNVSRPGAVGSAAVAMAPRPALDSTPAHSEPVPKRSQLETPLPPEVHAAPLVVNSRLPELPPAPLPKPAPPSPPTFVTSAPPLVPANDSAEPDTLARSSWAAPVQERAASAFTAPVPPSPASPSLPFPGAPALELPSLAVASTPVPVRATSSTAGPLLGAAPPPPPKAAPRAASMPGVPQAPVAAPLPPKRSRRGWVVAAVGLGVLFCAVPAALFALHLGPFATVAAATPPVSKAQEAPPPAEAAAVPLSGADVVEKPAAEIADPEEALTAAPSLAAPSSAAVPSEAEATEEAAATAEAEPPSVGVAPTAAEAPEVADVESYEARILNPFVNQLMQRVSHCHEGGRANGTALLTLTFAPSGHVSQARLEGEPIASAPVSRCIMAHARALILPPFKGEPIEVTRTLTLE